MGQGNKGHRNKKKIWGKTGLYTGQNQMRSLRPALPATKQKHSVLGTVPGKEKEDSKVKGEKKSEKGGRTNFV